MHCKNERLKRPDQHPVLTGNQGLELALCLVLLLASGLLCPETNAQQANSSRPAIEGSANIESAAEPRIKQRFFRWSKITDAQIEQMGDRELARRPLLYWRRWSNQRPHPIFAFYFLLITTIIAVEFMPAKLEPVVDFCRAHFWKSMGTGILFCSLVLLMARPLFITEIGTPLAFLLIAVLQLFMLIGFAVSATLIGAQSLSVVRLDRLPLLTRQPTLLRFMRTLTGTLLLTALLMLPGIGHLPRLGIRLVALLCTLGTGALLRTKLGFSGGLPQK